MDDAKLDLPATTDAAPDGFESWYRQSHDRLLRSLLVLTGDPDEAHEVVAEACARCLGCWKRRRPNDPTAWTFRVAVNLAHRRGRRRSTERIVLDRFRSDPSSPSASSNRIGLPEIELWQAVAGLPERQRIAVVLRYLGDLTEAQTAEAMGVASGTASASLSAARASLARTLTVEEDAHHDA